MQDNTLNDLQKYLEYIRYNTMDFGVRLLKPFLVYKYYVNKDKFQVILNEKNDNDCYWVTKIELDNFLSGKCSNKVNLKLDRPFQDEYSSGFYLSLSDNNLSPKIDDIQRLYGLRFKKNDLFYKIIDVSYQQLSMSYDEPNEIKDNIKILIVEDFHVDDFIEVNKFVDKGRSAKRGMGYSIEIDEDYNSEYLNISDVKKAIKMAKSESLKEILEDLDFVFIDGNKVGDHVKEIINRRLG